MIQADEARRIIAFSSYLKAQKNINSISEDPQDNLPNYLSDPNDCASMDYVPAIMSRLSKTIILEEPDDEYRKVIENIDGNVENMYLSISAVFYFGLLFENLDLLTLNEQMDWKNRMRSLFDDLGSEVFTPFSDFYNLNFRTQFLGGDKEFYLSQYPKMQHTFVFVYQYEWHTVDEFGAGTMEKMEALAKNYVQFYRDLIPVIQERKKEVKKIA